MSNCLRIHSQLQFEVSSTSSSSITVVFITVKSRLLAALVDKPQAHIMCQKPGKTLIPIDKQQVYFVDVVKCVSVTTGVK